MFWDLVLVLLIASGVILLIWCLIGALLQPVFCTEMVTYLPVSGIADKLEQRVRAYAWLRDGRVSGGKLVLVDCGLNEQGRRLADVLCVKYEWVELCQSPEAEKYIHI